MVLLREIFSTIWNNRSFISSTIKSDIKGQFARSQFGFAWLVIHPLAQALMFAVVLSNLMAARLPGIEGTYGYAIYLLSGILAWNLFAEILSRSMTMFIEYANVMKKISFPKIAIPFIVVGRAMLNNVFLLLAVILVSAVLGSTPDRFYLGLPFIVMMNVALAMALGIILGVFNVFVRDVGEVMQVVLQFWFWMTPIVYPVSIIPESLRPLINLNPMYHIVSWYHEIMVFKTFALHSEMLWITLLVTGLLAAAMVLFRRASPELVDVL